MIEPAVRLARSDERDQLTWLEDVARAGLADQRGGDLWLAIHPAQSPGWEAADRDEVAVGLIDEVVVGYLRFHVDDGVLHVDDVFVHPGARELGFGDALLAEVRRIGAERGAARVQAEALPGDRDTKNLYERAGITAKRIIVSAPVVATESV
jgi:ribosomal protein S18 acetylase RimI-like enzyme